MIGTQVGSYKIVSQLATGGMGAVYVAHHDLMNRDAVVKVLLPAFSAKTEMVKRFFNEARAAASIHHPGIVEIYDLGYMSDGLAYIVMEKLRGDTVSARLAREGRIELERAVTYVRHMASALGAAHAAGIIHRDLKPDNLFIVPDPGVPGGERIKVVDFGIAKLQMNPGSLATAAGSIFGTPAYMAPEQCSDAATVDARADLYAIGCIFYELLCGQPPFGKAGGIELLAAQLRDTPAPPRSHNPSIPPGIEQVIMRLLAKKPEARFGSCEELIQQLGAFAQPPGQRASTGAEAYAATMPPPAATPRQDISRAPTEMASFAPGGTPSVPGSPEAVPLSTYQSASGQVSNTLPLQVAPPKKRTGLIAGLLVVVAAAGGVTAYALTRGGDGGDASSAAPPDAAVMATIDAGAVVPPDAAAVIVADAASPPDAAPKKRRHRKRVDLLTELEKAEAKKDYAAVAKIFAKMKRGSRGYVAAKALHDSAMRSYTQQVRKQAVELRKAKKCTELAALEQEAKKVYDRAAKVAANQGRRCEKQNKSATQPAASPKALTTEAKNAAHRRQFAKALRLCEQALAKGAGPSARMVCAIAACNLKRTATAQKHIRALTGPRQGMARQICLRNGVKP